MTSFYNKYFITNGNSTDTNTNVLKKDYTLDYTDYEKLKINEQYNKLYSNIYEKNKENISLNENKKIFNMSIKQLIDNASIVYLNLLNDLSVYFSKDNNDKSINKLGYIITKNDNLLYIGLFILILSFLLWLIDVTK